MDLWLPGYEHDPESGAGLSVSPGRPKVVIHTTESGPGSLAAIRNLWRGSANWGRGLPHFIAEGDRYVQLLPLNVGAYTLQNAPGGADTNRSGPAIQVEIVGYARDEFTDVELDALGRWLADLVCAGVDLDLSQHPRFYGEGDGIVLASESSPIRMSAAAWTGFNGFCGHQHACENSHWDPGHLDADRVERIARVHLAGTTPPTQEDDDMVTIVIATTRPDSKWWVEEAGGQPGTVGIVKLLSTDQFARPMTLDEVRGNLQLRDYVVATGGKDYIAKPGAVDDWMLYDRTFLPRRLPSGEATAVVSLTAEQVTQLGRELGVNLAASVADELHERLAS